MLVELETIFEAGLGELANEVVFFLLCHERASGQLWKRKVEWLG